VSRFQKIALAAFGATLLSAGSAAPVPQPLTCDAQVLNTDASFYLERDLTCSTPVLITAQAYGSLIPHVTVDLRGHRLSGSGGNTAVEAGNYGGTSVTVVNGTITNFANGVLVNEGTSGTVQNVTFTSNQSGLNCFNSNNCVIQDSQFTGNTIGLWAHGGEPTSARVTNSTFTNNQTGIAVDGLFNHATLDHVTLIANKVGVEVRIAPTLTKTKFIANKINISGC
jgi:Periplasmic copper-binding protein (NosD)